MKSTFLQGLKSRRFLLAILGAVGAFVADYFGVDKETVAMALAVLGTFIAGESYQGGQALKGVTPETVNVATTGNVQATPGQMVGNLALGYAERRLNKPRSFADVDDELAELEIPVDSQ